MGDPPELTDAYLTIFLDTAIAVCQDTDKQLREAMLPAHEESGLHWHTHHGIWLHRENDLTLLIYLALVRANFPLNPARGLCYPSGGEMDLAFLGGARRNKLIACFEAKPYDNPAGTAKSALDGLLPLVCADGNKMKRNLVGLPDVRMFGLLFWLTSDATSLRREIEQLSADKRFCFSAAWHRSFGPTSRFFYGGYAMRNGCLELSMSTVAQRKDRYFSLALVEFQPSGVAQP